MSDSWTSQHQIQDPPKTPFFKTLIDIVVAPFDAFRALFARPTFFMPLLLLVMMQIILTVTYFQTVDFDWYVDATVAQLPADAPAENREATASGIRTLGPTVLMTISILAALFVVPAILALFALYFLIVSAITSDGVKYKHWFSLLCWCSIPTVFQLLATLVNVLMAGGQIRLETANPLTLNNLIFSLQPDHKLFVLVNYLDLTNIWGMVLLVIGYKIFTKRDWLVSALIALGPYLVIVLGYLLFFV